MAAGLKRETTAHGRTEPEDDWIAIVGGALHLQVFRHCLDAKRMMGNLFVTVYLLAPHQAGVQVSELRHVHSHRTEGFITSHAPISQ